MNTHKELQKRLDREGLRALHARWSETVRYEIYLLVGEHHDILHIERAVFEMLLDTPGPVERLDHGHIEDTVSFVCEEYGGPPHFDWDGFLEDWAAEEKRKARAAKKDARNEVRLLAKLAARNAKLEAKKGGNAV